MIHINKIPFFFRSKVSISNESRDRSIKRD